MDDIRARLAAAPQGAAMELDDTPRQDTWRIVEASARRDRECQGYSARPQYAATVYSKAHAVFYTCAPSDMQRLFDQIERFKAVLKQMAEGLEVLQTMTATTKGDLAKKDADMAYEYATELGDALWKVVKEKPR